MEDCGRTIPDGSRKREEYARLVGHLTATDSVTDFSLTTNDLLLTRNPANQPRDAGLQRITISLDTLDGFTLRQRLYARSVGSAALSQLQLITEERQPSVSAMQMEGVKLVLLLLYRNRFGINVSVPDLQPRGKMYNCLFVSQGQDLRCLLRQCDGDKYISVA